MAKLSISHNSTKTSSHHRMEKRFSIRYPLSHKVIRDLKIITEHVGVLDVEGTVYCHPRVPRVDVNERYSLKIEAIRWHGCDILAVLEVFEAVEEIEDYCLPLAAELFTEERGEAI